MRAAWRNAPLPDPAGPWAGRAVASVPACRDTIALATIRPKLPPRGPDRARDFPVRSLGQAFVEGIGVRHRSRM